MSLKELCRLASLANRNNGIMVCNEKPKVFHSLFQNQKEKREIQGSPRIFERTTSGLGKNIERNWSSMCVHVPK
jgi:hypothetical protein